MYSGDSLEVEISVNSFGILEVCDGAKDNRRPMQCTREGPKRSKQALSRLAPWILEVCEGAKDSSRPVQCTRETP